jgi:hypothetical protein
MLKWTFSIFNVAHTQKPKFYINLTNMSQAKYKQDLTTTSTMRPKLNIKCEIMEGATAI